MANESIVRYALVDIEVTHPIGGLSLAAGEVGAAVLVRRKGIPIGFWLQEAGGARSISADELTRRIETEAGETIVAQTIREELLPRFSCHPLPLVTIAVCTRNRPEAVERLLRSLIGQASGLPTGSAGLDTLLVDNAPSDERTRELAARWPDVRYVTEPQPGLNFARNRALVEARGEILAFLDDDVIADRHWSRGLADAWAENRDAAAFTGQVLPMEINTEAQAIFEYRGGFRRGFERVRYGQVMPGNRLYPGGAGIFGAGANMAFRTDVIRRLGGFDEALDTGAPLPGGGDLDMFYRIVRAGHPLVYEPRFLVFHQHRREMDALRSQYRRSWGFGFMCYVSKCLKTDPERRVNLTRLILWWFVNDLKDVVKQVRKRARRERHVPPSIIVAELCGGVAGLLGGYARSQRRVAGLRTRFT
jgi:glycosyltransferase involved in cell wall biosynthesis